MALGLVLGGVASGFGKGLDYAKQIKEGREADDKRAREKKIRGMVDDAPDQGQMVDYNYDPAKAAQAAGDAATPAQSQSLIGRLFHHVQPDVAAAKAGLQMQPAAATPAAGPATGLAQPAAAAAPAGAQGPAPAAPSGEANLNEVTVTPNKTRKVTAMDQAMYMLQVAKASGDPAKLTAAMQQFDNVSKDEAVQDLAVNGRSMSGLENLLHKWGHTLDYAEGEGGKYKVTVDGHDVGEMTTDEARDMATEYVTKTPGYAAAAARQRTADDRATMAARADATYKTAKAAVDQQEANTRELVGKANAARDQAATALTLDKYTRQKSFQNMLFDGDGAGDAFLNADQLRAQASTAYDPVTKIVNDENGQQQEVVISPGKALADTEIAAAANRFKASPWAQQGQITLGENGGRRYYMVKGITDGGFTNLSAAENAARRKYGNPKPAAAAPAPKGK